MNKFFHSVYLEDEKCTGCITCLKRCPTQAIRVRNGKHILSVNLYWLTENVSGIVLIMQNIPDAIFLSDLDRFEYTVALPAPSLYSQFKQCTRQRHPSDCTDLMAWWCFWSQCRCRDLFRNYHELILMSIRNFIRWSVPHVQPLNDWSVSVFRDWSRICCHCFHPWKQLRFWRADVQ